MRLPYDLRKIKLYRRGRMCKKNRIKEVCLYLFFGGLAFLISISTFALFHLIMGIDELIANIWSWIAAVVFAFFTNRVWVFDAPTKTLKGFLAQAGSFFGGRMITLLVEEAVLFAFITVLEFPGMSVKIAAQILVIVVNYVFSRFIIFKKT